MKFKDALQVRPGEIISLVGGGGKTTTTYALAHELVGPNACVISTTTTKIFAPTPAQSEMLICESDEALLFTRLAEEVIKHRHITVAAEQTPSGKLSGISAAAAARLIGIPGISCVINEADGSRKHSLKAPNATEPVYPENTTLVVAVAGIDALDGVLSEVVHRPEIAVDILGVPPDARITVGLMARLITGVRGITKGRPPGARVVLFINKVDNEEYLVKAREVARAVLYATDSPINTVIIGRAQAADPVIEVMRKIS